MRSLKRLLRFSLIIATAIVITYSNCGSRSKNGNPARGTSTLPFNNQMYQTDDRGRYRIYGLSAGRRLETRALREAEALQKEIPFKPCEQTPDYVLAYGPGPAPRQ